MIYLAYDIEYQNSHYFFFLVWDVDAKNVFILKM